MRRARTASGQRGGAALLVAFMLVVLMAAGGLATASNVVRELSLCAVAARAAEAAEAAESGVAWFRAWVSRPAGAAFLAALATGAEAEAPVPEQAGFRARVRGLGSLAESDAQAADGVPEVAAPDQPGTACWLVTVVGSSTAPEPFLQARTTLLIPEPGGFRWRTWPVQVETGAGDAFRPTSATSP